MHHLERYTSPKWPAKHASHNRGRAPHAFGPRKRPGNSLNSKCDRNGTANSGHNPRARHRPLAHQNAPSRALHGPGMAHPRTPPQKRHARVLSTRRDASRDPFALKRCVLETCGTSKLLAERPTSRPSKCIILSVTRVVSGASTHTRTETLRMLTLAPPKRLPGPLCTQNVLTTYGTSESARISRSSKCIMSRFCLPSRPTAKGCLARLRACVLEGGSGQTMHMRRFRGYVHSRAIWAGATQ